MGVTISYRGTLDDLAQLPRLVDELTDIAQAMAWPCRPMDGDWSAPADAKMQAGSTTGNLGLKGVILSPHPKSESLPFLFSPEGMLHSVISRCWELEGQVDPDLAWIFVKTQFAPVDTHIRIVGLLKYLKSRYLSNLEVRDEGQYWESGDLERLVSLRTGVARGIETLAEKLQHGGLGDAEIHSAEDIAARIEEMFRDL